MALSNLYLSDGKIVSLIKEQLRENTKVSEINLEGNQISDLGLKNVLREIKSR